MPKKVKKSQVTTKKLRRPRDGKVLAGVAAAFANYFDVDVVLSRIIWALLLLPGGFPGLMLYIVCWVVIPEEE